jgi:hypothetical protein
VNKFFDTAIFQKKTGDCASFWQTFHKTALHSGFGGWAMIAKGRGKSRKRAMVE